MRFAPIPTNIILTTTTICCCSTIGSAFHVTTTWSTVFQHSLSEMQKASSSSIQQSTIDDDQQLSLSSINFNVDDFTNDVVGSFVLDDNIYDDDLGDETNDETLLFVQMIENTPRGQLDDEEILALQEVLNSLSSPQTSLVVADKQDLTIVAERLLLRWVEEYKVRPTCINKPTTNDFLIVMQQWENLILSDKILEPSSSTSLSATMNNINTDILPTSIDHIRMLLSLLKDCYHNTSPSDDTETSLKPNLEVYRIVLRVLSYSRERQIDRKGEKLFYEMQNDYFIQPDASTYESMIYMLAKSRNDGAAHRAERLLREAVLAVQNNQSSSTSTMINIDTFNVVMTAWAKSGIDYGPERAEQLIHLMSDIDLEPNVHSFTSLIDAYAQVMTWDSATQCERIFNRVLDLYLNDENGGTKNKLLEPNIVSWSVVISAWGRLAKDGQRGAGMRADKLLRRMETLYKEGRISFGPDSMLYTKCLNANAYSQTVESLTRAKHILDEMYERYLDGEDKFMPSSRTISILIDSWVRSRLPNKMDEAEAIFSKYKDHLLALQELSNDDGGSVATIYKTMVIGWADDGDPILGQEWLEEMIEKDIIPQSMCFEKIIDSNTLINDKSSIKRSYAIFQMLERLRIQKHDFCPTERGYTAFIRAMTKAGAKNMAQKSNQIVQQMEEIYRQGNNDQILPSIFTYNAVLLACAETVSHTDDQEQHKEVLRLAVTIFNNLRKGTSSCDLDNVSFGNMLRCSKLFPPESKQKDEFIVSIFQLCCERGMVNQFILRDLYMVSSDELRINLLSTDKALNDLILEDDLPSSWQRNAMKKPIKQMENSGMRKNIVPRGKGPSKPFRTKQR